MAEPLPILNTLLTVVILICSASLIATNFTGPKNFFAASVVGEGGVSQPLTFGSLPFNLADDLANAGKEHPGGGEGPPPTPSETPTPTSTSTSTPTPTSTSTPTPSPTSRPALDTARCARAAFTWLNATNGLANGNCPHLGGPVHRIPISADLAHGALWEACSPEEAEATYFAYATSLLPSDVCYMVLSGDPGASATLNTGWASTVKNVWFVGPSADTTANPRSLAIPALVGLDRTKWLTKALPVMHALEGTQGCKWWYMGTESTWVNPRAILRAVRGIPHDTMPSFQGYMWLDQGFTDQVTATNGGTSLWSRAAWDAVIPRLDTPQCPSFQEEDSKTLPSDELVVAQCAELSGVFPFDFHVYDGTGAPQRNGVPMDPGPPHGERLEWIAQAGIRAGHWAWIDGMNGDFQRAIWAQHKAVYGPWGKLGEGGGKVEDVEASPSPTPAPPPAAAAAAASTIWSLPPGSSPCAVKATGELRALLDAGRTGPANAQPLTLDVVEEAIVGACAPSAGGDGFGGGGRHWAKEEHVCYLLRDDGEGNTARMMNQGWGWRIPHGGSTPPVALASSARLLWVAQEGEGGEGGLHIPGLTSTLGEGERMRAGLQAWASEPSSAHCDWVYVGATTDWVNPRSMTSLLRGLRDDIPVRIGLHLHAPAAPTPPVSPDGPALGRQVLSRAAVTAILAHTPLATDPKPAGGAWGEDVNQAAAASGVLPINTYTIDVANFGPVTDWAFQQPHYLQGWAVIVDQDYDRATQILESYWTGIYGQCFNVAKTWKREACGWFWDKWGYPDPSPDRGLP